MVQAISSSSACQAGNATPIGVATMLPRGVADTSLLNGTAPLLRPQTPRGEKYCAGTPSWPSEQLASPRWCSEWPTAPAVQTSVGAAIQSASSSVSCIASCHMWSTSFSQAQGCRRDALQLLYNIGFVSNEDDASNLGSEDFEVLIQIAEQMLD